MYELNKYLNVLIFPSGSGVGKEIFDSLKYIRWINIYGLESDENNYSFYQFDKFIQNAPFVKEEEKTIIFLKEIIEKYDIHCIFPAFDNIIIFLKKYENELNVKIISSPLNTCEICFSKKKTYTLFKDKINIPFIYEKNNSDYNFPLFIKPECGYGSRDSYKLNNEEELIFYSQKIKNPILCEYLTGEEFTVDCFTSKKYGLLFSKARTRSKTLNGMSILTKTIDLPNVEKIAQFINSHLSFIGAWFFQLKYNSKNELTLLEIAPRIPAAMSLHRCLGINFPLLSIYEQFDYPIDKIYMNHYYIQCYKYFENRYYLDIDYNNVYIDFDDTIIIKNKVNTKIIQYLYYCINQQKKIVLITKNSNIFLSLEKYKIDKNIFNSIIQLNKSEKKSDYIKLKDSIFIDDSFQERIDVYTNCNIPIFNCDMIEALMNEKL